MTISDGTNTAADTDGDMSPKARRTQETLIQAAWTVFGRDGFVDARISDIAAEAQVAHGTFYNYFDSKEAVFREVMVRLYDELKDDANVSPYHSDDPVERIEHANRHYIDVCRRNAGLLATVEQMVTVSADIRRLRREIRTPWLQRNIRAIKKWQEAGIADPDLDAEYAAAALQAMVDRFMYIWVVLGYDFDEDRAVRTLTRMWAQAIGMRPPPSSKAPAKRASRRKAVPAR